MRKMLVAFGLMVLSMSALADESGVQMVLDSVHNAGFTGCDEKIRMNVEHISNIYYVETKLPFTTGSGKNAVALNDEVVVVYGASSDPQYGWEEHFDSFMVRKIGKECVVVRGISVGASTNRNCQTIANLQDDHYAVVTKSNDGSYWTRSGSSNSGLDAQYQRDGTKMIYTPLSGGACRFIKLPSKHWAQW